ncbi:hypothetical protein ACDQ55_16595 [Chitinophaga sp. 30R24]|uniref:hypothetical protein n=1 Tax=Chitinophaga sp. 30R24 TaxID=3248838 RepID=UPI003B9143E5
MPYIVSIPLLCVKISSAQSIDTSSRLPFTPQFNNINFLTTGVKAQQTTTVHLIHEVNNLKEKTQSTFQVQQALKELQTENKRDEVISSYAITRSYWDALSVLESMLTLPDNTFSLIQAVYTVENAYLDQRIPFGTFRSLIKAKADLCKYIIRKEKLDSTDNLAKNYAIQKIFSDTVLYFDKKTNQLKKILPFRYDFEDYKGENHWENMFVSKLLYTGKGQCHSLPLVYLMLAEELGAKAYLSIAPEHSYIQFLDGNGKAYNFETTSDILVSNNWIMQSGFMNTSSIKQRTYMDTLDRKKLMAFIVMDLTMGYMQKFGFDDFVLQAMNKVKELHPQNLNALLLESNMITYQTMAMLKAAGNPPPQKLYQYPQIYDQYQKMLDIYNQIDDLGFQAMPPEAYQSWLNQLKRRKPNSLIRNSGKAYSIIFRSIIIQ